MGARQLRVRSALYRPSLSLTTWAWWSGTTSCARQCRYSQGTARAQGSMHSGGVCADALIGVVLREGQTRQQGKGTRGSGELSLSCNGGSAPLWCSTELGVEGSVSPWHIPMPSRTVPSPQAQRELLADRAQQFRCHICPPISPATYIPYRYTLLHPLYPLTSSVPSYIPYIPDGLTP